MDLSFDVPQAPLYLYPYTRTEAYLSSAELWWEEEARSEVKGHPPPENYTDRLEVNCRLLEPARCRGHAHLRLVAEATPTRGSLPRPRPPAARCRGHAHPRLVAEATPTCGSLPRPRPPAARCRGHAHLRLVADDTPTCGSLPRPRPPAARCRGHAHLRLVADDTPTCGSHAEEAGGHVTDAGHHLKPGIKEGRRKQAVREE
ncbi:hypothetical protein EYF80_056211 [Liparis tanakae]|uniref:Uncharacterized protein n=1 Tax=Liparis tanakae TaxID=230148 RepID=A0A4Z2EYL9_9TELE|nr:hypothetical protein EYF80_056211 [Liparis tanakae]